MKIGEFARLCKTRVSVLRHYDKMGLLRPVYVDRFTEYRYYDRSQAAAFDRISELKSAGLSLSEIKIVLCTPENAAEIFARREAELKRMLRCLADLKRKTTGGMIMKTFKPLWEDTDIKFENDENAVGKWQVITKRQDGRPIIGDINGYLYFLPEGKPWWCFSWTKGKLIFSNAETRFSNDYRMEERQDGLYMIVNYKEQDYPESGNTIKIELKKCDSKPYTLAEIAVKDDINKPFADDPAIIGRWKACGLCREKDDFPLNAEEQDCALFFKSITFEPGGHCSSVYGEKTVSGDEKQTWTKGCVLCKWNSTSCAYEIRRLAKKEYLFIEWKSGDYTLAGLKPVYYVMERG